MHTAHGTKLYGNVTVTRWLACLMVGLVVGLAGMGGAQAQAIIGTAGDGEVAIVLPTPGVGLPTPTQNVVPGLPSGARPHGVDYYGADHALIADFSNNRVFNIQVSTASLINTIATPGYSGMGSIAVAPSLQHALAMGGNSSNTLTVIQAPFNAPTLSTVTLSGEVLTYQTHGIDFAPSGRAFVYTTTGIQVLDPPYASVAFSIPVSGNARSGGIAVSPNGNTLLITKYGNTIEIFNAPFSAASVGTTLTIPGAVDLAGVAITPDGSQAIVVAGASSGAHAYGISAPFTASSTVAAIPVPADGSGFEDVGISPDGQLAILTGNSVGSRRDAMFIQAPFNASATVTPVTIGSAGPPDTRGRGAGAVRFLPAGLAPGLVLEKSGPASAAEASTFSYIIAYGNTGGATASNVILRETIPAGASFVSATNGGTLAGGVVSWNIGSLAPGASGSVSFTVNVTAAAGSSILNGEYTIEGTAIAPIYGAPVSTTVTPRAPAPVAPTFVPFVGDEARLLLIVLFAVLGLAAIGLGRRS